MKSLFNQDFFVGNRRALKASFRGTAPIVVPAAGALQKSGSLTHVFKQDANFWYLTGLDEADLVLVIDGESEYLIAPTRSSARETFDGRLTTPDIVERSGIAEVLDDKVGWQRLAGRLKKVKHVATLSPPPPYVPQLGFYTNPGRVSLIARLREYQPELEIVDINKQLVSLRAIKQAPELRAIEAAIEVTIKSLTEALEPAKLRKYRHEYEIEAELYYGVRRRGATGFGFDTIVASGANACTIHYIANSDPIKKGQLVLIDVGAEVDHYSADISRTVSLSKPTKRQQAIYRSVASVQDFAFSLLKPGLMMRRLEEQVLESLGKELKSLGLINIQTEETIRRFYPHLVTHLLGLNVHDPADYEQPLKPGMVMTIEPGLYLPEEGIGVRLEDDVLITKEGYVNLSKKLPRQL